MTDHPQEALPPPPKLPVQFIPFGGCTCAGPDGPCAGCIANAEAYDEWLTEPIFSPREAMDYARAYAEAAVARERERLADEIERLRDFAEWCLSDKQYDSRDLSIRARACIEPKQKD